MSLKQRTTFEVVVEHFYGWGQNVAVGDPGGFGKHVAERVQLDRFGHNMKLVSVAKSKVEDAPLTDAEKLREIRAFIEGTQRGDIPARDAVGRIAEVLVS